MSTLLSRSTACVILMMSVFALTAYGQNTATWEVWRVENPGKISDHSTDSVVVKFDTVQGRVNATIICEARQTFGSRTTRRLTMRIENFNGVGQYTPLTGNASTSWENFSRDSLCGCLDNSANRVSITQWDTVLRVMSGTFDFRCRSFIAVSGDETLYRIRNGQFRWGGTDKIVLTTTPKDTVRVPKITASDTTISITITATERTSPVEGVTIKVLDKTVTGSTVYQEKGATGADGTFSYAVKLQRDAPAGDYEVKLYGTKSGHDSSDTTTILIRYSSRIWEYKCVGVTLLSFDAGEGKEWKPVSEGSPIVTARGAIVVEDVFVLRGRVRINTSSGAEKVFLDSGNVFLKTSDDLGNPIETPFDELLGSDHSMSLPDCTGLFDLYRDSTVKILSKKLFNTIEVSIEKFSIINRPTGKGIDIEGKISLGALARLGCDAVQDPTGNLDADPARRAITIGIALTTAGFDNLRIKVENLKATDAFCLREISASLDNFNKTASFGAKVKMLFKGQEFTGTFDSFWKSSTGSLNPREMSLDSLRAELELESCKPISQTPFCFKAAKFSTSGWANATPAGLTFRLGAVVNSAEQSIMQLAPWIVKLMDSAQIVQFEGTLQYTHPLIFTGSIAARLLRISKPFATKPWQCEGLATLSLDMNNRLSATLTGNYFHLGADDYFVSGQITQQIYWNPMLGYSGMASGSFRIPAPGPELLAVPGVGSVLRFMKFSGWIPQTLGQAQISAVLNQDDGFRFRGTVDVSQNPVSYIRSFGIMSVKVSDKDGVWDVDLQQGTLPPASGIKTGSDVQAMPAKATETITVDESMTRVFVMITGKTSAPVSKLVDPSGTIYTGTSSDSSVQVFSTPGNEMVQWTLVKPELGNWILQLTDPQDGDEVEVMVQRSARPFAIAVDQQGAEITVTWDPATRDDNGDVDIYLDEDGVGFDGMYIGKSEEQTGTFHYTLPASLKECSYRIYAHRFVPGEPEATVYADNKITSNNAAVPQPLNVVATSNQSGLTAISWSVPPGSALSGFLIYTFDGQGKSELVATAQSDQRRVEVNIIDHELKTIGIRGYDDLDERSCPSPLVGITTGITERHVAFTSTAGTMAIMPNPAQSVVRIRYHVPGSHVKAIQVCDMLGQTVFQQLVDSSEEENLLTVSCTDLSTGAYIVRLHVSSGFIDGMLHIVR